MPNGKPGDHPLTDILLHKTNLYGDGIDDLVREISQLPSFNLIRERLATLLGDNYPLINRPINKESLRQELLNLKAEIK